jgi:hypothetical protein
MRAVAKIFALTLAVGALSGCQDNPYCFADCGEAQGGSAGSGVTGGSAGSAGSILVSGNGGSAGSAGSIFGGSAGAGECVQTPSPTEICDNLDNDCNGTVDDVAPEELLKPTSCGSCANNCLSKVQGVTPSSVQCAEGSCGYTECSSGFFDVDGDKSNGCEYACTPSAGGSEVCDGIDNDCDGKKDEDTDFCSLSSCGSCQPCPSGAFLNGTLRCDKIDAAKECRDGDSANAQCVVDTCQPGFIDKNKNPLDGCEFQCTPSADPTEVCDGVDNDCDGKIDAEDDDLQDTAGTPDSEKLGASCFGAPDGECAKPERAGVIVCVNALKRCQGPEVRLKDEVAESCNGLDDDCDGEVDDKPTDAGSLCGGVNGVSVGVCIASVLTCINGQIECPGSVGPDPAGDACDGVDNDCDDVIDGSKIAPEKTCATDAECDDGDPAEIEGCLTLASNPGKKVCARLPKIPQPVGSDCSVPLAVTSPPGTTAVSGCKKGAWACQGGSPVCVGAVEALPGAVDSCNIDRDCNGSYDGVVLDFSSDSQNCGSCGNQCKPPAGSNLLYVCQNSQCVPAPNEQCLPGFQTCDAANPCAYACTKTTDFEVCNGIDDDCNCQVDDNVVNPPNPKGVCGTADAAQLTDNRCKPKTVANPQGVEVVCEGAAWRCKFSDPTYCDPDNNPATPASCPTAPDPCDTKDNNCNGQADDAFLIGQTGLGNTCASDDGLPAPGHGQCRRTGKFVCKADGTGTQCDAVKADCAANPGGCEELCDGLDNDCDGLIDETFANKGTNASFFLKPGVVKITGGAGASGTFVFAYEASRPSADETDSGNGNGYTSNPPPDVTPERTLACSKPSSIPWTDITPREAVQACGSVGGRLCTLAEWRRTCQVNNNDGAGPSSPDTDNNCTYGFSPPGTAASAACKQAPTFTPNSARLCNLGGYDFSPAIAGDQDGVLPTASGELNNCFANWSGLNGVANQRAFDITGNVREISVCQLDRSVCGPDEAACARRCCSGTSQLQGTTRLCGTPGNARRLSGQACTANSQCCNQDLNCSGDGTCAVDVTNNNSNLYCRNTGVPAPSCRGVGVACTADNQCCNGERCTGGLCGGPGTLPGAVYPLLGGSYTTDSEAGATCSFDFYKVNGGFKLFDTGFRCCFDSNPTQ